MPVYDRSDPTDHREIDRWDGGVGWIAHPREVGQRASHAVVGDDGVWLFDPLDAPGVDELLAGLGPVAGVAVLSPWHARDADAFARRHDVPVSLPAWMVRAADRIDAPVDRFTGALGGSGFRVRRYEPFPGWREGIVYRESDRSLYVPEAMGTARWHVVGDERLGVAPICRLVPPRRPLAGLDPDRVLVGHGTGVTTDASAALADALAGSRRRFLRALVANGPTQLRSAVEALTR